MKKNFATVARAFMGLAVLFLGASCAKEMHAPEAESDGFAVRLSLTAQDFTPVTPTKTVSPSTVKDVTVLQFQGGTLKKMFTLMDKPFTSESVNVEGFISQPAAVLDAQGKIVNNATANVIVFLANMSEASNNLLRDLTENTTTYVQFLAASYQFTNADAISGLQYIPMYGIHTSGLTDGVTNSISVSLTRALAYINFTVDVSNFSLPEKTLVGTPTVSNMEIHNVPLELTLPNKTNRPALPVNSANGVWPDNQVPYPTYVESANNFVKFGEVAELAQTNNTTATNFQFYVTENCRGSLSDITTYDQKKAKDNSTLPGLMYLTFNVNYATTDGAEGYATYRINLGGNNTGDFNIRGGAQYNVTTYVYGIGNEETRQNITVTNTFDLTGITAADSFTLLPDANCYMLEPSKIGASDNLYDGKTLMLRLTQPRNGWKWIQDNDGQNATYVTDLDALIKAGKYEVTTLWQTVSTGAFNVTGEKVSAADLTRDGGVTTDQSYYYVKLNSLPNPANNGSALIVLKATEDQGTTIKANDILWSWHLWFTDYAPDYDGEGHDINSASITGTGCVTEVKSGATHRYNGAAFGTSGSYPNGQGMMDRNLGATYSVVSTTTSISDMIKDHIDNGSAVSDGNFNALRGMYYQFGRKDPFPHTNGGNVDINTIKVKDGEGNDFTFKNEYAKGSTPSQLNKTTSDLKYAVNHPDTFVSDDYVWHNPQFSYDWPAVFDPSPAGWSVSKGGGEASNVWWDFSDASNQYNTNIVSKAATFSTSSSDLAGWAAYLVTGTKGESSAKWAYYPAGSWIESTEGYFHDVSMRGNCWSSTLQSNSNGYYMLFNASTFSKMSLMGRAGACPVRCVKN